MPLFNLETRFATLRKFLPQVRPGYTTTSRLLLIAAIAVQTLFPSTSFAQDDSASYPPIPPWIQSGPNAASSAAAMPALTRAQLRGAAAVGSTPSLNAAAAADPSQLNALAAHNQASGAGNPLAADGSTATLAKPAASTSVKPEPPTAFQRFVADTTGRMLPVFGQNLFTGARADAYTPVGNVPAPADYLIGPGDEIQLQVWGGVDGNMRLSVDRNGQINIPKIGAVTVAGVRASDLNGVLKRQIGRVFSNFQVNATLGQLRSIQVYVVGHARRPGAYTVSSLSTLVNALFESGGPALDGSMRTIELRRGGQLVTTLDLYGFITKGNADGDIHLLPGDVIVIPPAGPRVALLGALDTPAIYELKSPSEPLGQILGYAGGTTALTSTDKVTIERVTDPTLDQPSRRVEERRLDATGLGSTVKDGDVITLQRINPSFTNAVTLRGNVAVPLRYPYTPGMKLSDLLPEPAALLTPDYFRRKNVLVQLDQPDHAVGDTQLSKQISHVQNLVDEPNWSYAVIERLDPKNLTTQLIPFNLGAVVHKTDPTQDLQLQPGDIVTIFGKRDMRLPQAEHTRLVRVDGEVRAAGVYELQPGDTIQSILRRAGGLTPEAYVYGVEFTREQTRETQTKNLQNAINRAEEQSSAKLAAAVANLPTSTDSKGLQDQMAREQSAELRRLHNLKPSGRVSLELATDAHAIGDLPDLPLENGDAIYVPPRPAFVTVVGAVDNENALIWKPGRTVGDALRIAGVQRDIAEPDSAFVLRADGSVFNRDSAHWMSSLESTKLMPGDTVVIPEKIDPRSGMTKFIAGLKDWSQVLANFGLGAAAIQVLK
jgi:protein involved in polysaccharide export with SLBB domain